MSTSVECAHQSSFVSQISIILGGYKDKIENDLYAADKGLRSRFIPFEFADYSDAELFRILKTKCDEDRCVLLTSRQLVIIF